MKRDLKETVARTKVWALLVPCQRAALPLVTEAKVGSFPSGSVHNVVLWARLVSDQDKAKPDSLP